jgi:hypothetical protein
MFPSAHAQLITLYSKSVHSLIMSNNFEFTLVNIGKLLLEYAKLDYYNEGT